VKKQKEAPHPIVAREDDRWVREIVTPEGVAIRFTLARGGDRASAFLIDVLIQIFAAIAILLMLKVATGRAWESSWLTPFVIVLAFLVVNFYFAFFEVRWQGQTPGKKKIGIRVIDARGGQLETSAVLARNLVRELEVWTPLRFLLARGLVWPDAPTWASVLAIAWTFVFMFMPLFNKDRLRVGDIIGGTRVVVQPKLVLVPDLVAERVPDAAMAVAFGGVAQSPAHEFAGDQLAIYGIYELQVLEGVLRQDAATIGHYEAIRTVSEKIRIKIKFGAKVTDDERFLRDFYAALRAHLEQRMLFGERREDKFAAKSPAKK
jgi:uncharacterized RDD family membrane protein YckC